MIARRRGDQHIMVRFHVLLTALLGGRRLKQQLGGEPTHIQQGPHQRFISDAWRSTPARSPLMRTIPEFSNCCPVQSYCA